MHLLSNVGSEVVARVGIYEAWQLPLTLLALLIAALITKYPIGIFAEFENLVSRNCPPALPQRSADCRRRGQRSPGAFAVSRNSSAKYSRRSESHLSGQDVSHLLPNFASLFVILSPTYASMYPVLRSFPMFIGLLLGIGAWGGVLLSMVALTVAVYWMVRGGLH